VGASSFGIQVTHFHLETINVTPVLWFLTLENILGLFYTVLTLCSIFAFPFMLLHWLSSPFEPSRALDRQLLLVVLVLLAMLLLVLLP